MSVYKVNVDNLHVGISTLLGLLQVGLHANQILNEYSKHLYSNVTLYYLLIPYMHLALRQ